MIRSAILQLQSIAIDIQEPSYITRSVGSHPGNKSTPPLETLNSTSLNRLNVKRRIDKFIVWRIKQIVILTRNNDQAIWWMWVIDVPHMSWVNNRRFCGIYRSVYFICISTASNPQISLEIFMEIGSLVDFIATHISWNGCGSFSGPFQHSKLEEVGTNVMLDP